MEQKILLKEEIIKYLEWMKNVYGDEIISNLNLIRKNKDLKMTNSELLDQFRNEICNCTRCELGNTRTKFVFGTGSPDSKIMFIGEAPGRDEDRQGEPFVGRAGQLLTKILKAIDFEREDVYIANILKCRPPNNRDPLPAEIKLCEEYLIRQIEIIKPVIIVALGRIAAQNLLKSEAPLKEFRGKTHEYHGIPVIVTYHPAALLRNQNFKRPAWEDVQTVRKLYNKLIEEK